jgi:hypothetical protein
MNDLELLMAAAKAAGLKVIIPAAHQRGLWIEGLEDEWNPLEDDDNALRLAVKLNISVFFRPNFVHAEIATSAHEGLVLQEPPTPDKNAATRRAIVRAAAEIGANHGN